MRDLEADWEDQYDYSPNELVSLSRDNPNLYKKILRQNIGDENAINEWRMENLKRTKKYLIQQGIYE